MFKEFIWEKDIFLKTDHPIAVDSPDHLNPYGGTQDCTDGTEFAKELREVFPGKKFLLDLGTATGTVPMTMRKTGMLVVGLEGSDYSKSHRIGGWYECPEILMTCDISRPFEILDAEGKLFKFDFITAWSVIEHIHPDRIEICFNNIIKHLSPIGYSIFNIDIGVNEWHQFIKTRDELQEIVGSYFYLDEKMKNSREWHYCRPSAAELVQAKKKFGKHIQRDSGTTFWWVKKKGQNYYE